MTRVGTIAALLALAAVGSHGPPPGPLVLPLPLASYERIRAWGDAPVRRPASTRRKRNRKRRGWR